MFMLSVCRYENWNVIKMHLRIHNFVSLLLTSTSQCALLVLENAFSYFGFYCNECVLWVY